MNDLQRWRRRWPAIALVASLVLNGFLIGLLVTEAFGRIGAGTIGGTPRAVAFELRRLAERLPSDAVDQVAAELQPIRPQLETRLDRLRAIREDINRLAAEPAPDRARIDARLAELRAEGQAMQDEVQRATFDAILKLPPETRARLAEVPDSG